MHFYRLLRYRTGGVKRHETAPIVSATRTECEETILQDRDVRSGVITGQECRPGIPMKSSESTEVLRVNVHSQCSHTKHPSLPA